MRFIKAMTARLRQSLHNAEDFMSENQEHLDHALAEEFVGHAATIHTLKTSNAHFRGLMERNHALWLEIKEIQDGRRAAADEVLEDLEKRRLKVLDEIAGMIAKAEKAA